MSYSKLNSDAWMRQDSADPNVFSLEVDEDPFLLGSHTLSIEVTSIDYLVEILYR